MKISKIAHIKEHETHRNNIERSCLIKKAYDTKSEAERFGQMISKSFMLLGTRPYCCRFCGKWHLSKK